MEVSSIITWQVKAADEMVDFIKSIMQIENYIFKGSITDKNLLDIYSDVDICFKLSDATGIEERKLITALSEHFFNIIGYELHSGNEEDTLRVCFENGWRFDLTFQYPKSKESKQEDYSPDNSIESIINQFWYMSSMVLVKLGRKDFLVASHLVLELYQLIIVVQMILRDKTKGTDIHRFGDSEDVPILHTLKQMNEDTTEKEIIYLLFKAAEHMDKISISLLDVPERAGILRALQNG